MEHALHAQHVLANQYMEFVSYQLLGEAQHWWQGESFYRKYFPESVREAKKLELMQLKQGSLSVADYTSWFEELCRFSRVCQGASESYESWKCIKCQGGLRDTIMTATTPLEIRIFSELVNKARVVEECAKKVDSSRDTRMGNNNRGQEKYFQPRDQSFKRGGHAPQGQGGFKRNTYAQYHPVRGRGNQSKASPDSICNHCGRYHPNDSCKLGIGGCFTCGLPGHMAKDCLRGRNSNAGQNQYQGQVFVVNAQDATKADSLMRGICLIGGKMLIALYDTGASHSFISFDKVEELGLKVSELAFDLHVHTPYQTVVTRSGCRQVGFKLENREFVHDLICLPIVRFTGGNREIEFAIDLVPGAGLVSVTPYRMAPIELAELKSHLEEFLNKRFIRPSVSLWRAPILLVKKKDGGM
ncbi:uncharacterized protein LOC107611594 [Arachis ipaensis]|uniref:uncharacterized protein LOC107611594 n=1 Tax=Arachis ipaensis TaxID=130454 RepID=UPI0007AEFE36|nr:uncharacterized protein LOC107611594 [Arachis ipaensis]